MKPEIHAPELENLLRSLAPAAVSPALRTRVEEELRLDMSWLSPDDLDQLVSAESMFPSPIPVASVSSDEFMPAPQSPSTRQATQTWLLLQKGVLPLQAGLPGEPVYGMTPEAGLPKGWVQR